MERPPESNTDLSRFDIFSVVNNYFLLFFCASCVLASMYLQQMFMMVGQYRLGISVSAVVAIIVPVWMLTRRFSHGVRHQLRLARPRIHPMVMVMLATLAVVVVVDHIYLINQRFSPVPEYYTEGLRDLRPDNAGTFVLTFLGLCVCVPLAEEMVFRGVIQQIFTRNMGGVLGFVLAGLTFGAVHLNPHLLISISFFGIYLGFIYYATGNLTYTITAHALFNTVALIQLTATPVEEADLPFYLQDVRVFVIALVLLIFFLFKIKQGGSETKPPYETGQMHPPAI
jgi:membrane protease YdiL (CAAX protease family)